MLMDVVYYSEVINDMQTFNSEMAKILQAPVYPAVGMYKLFPLWQTNILNRESVSPRFYTLTTSLSWIASLLLSTLSPETRRRQPVLNTFLIHKALAGW